MDLADVRKLYTYNDWANERILVAIAGLTEEQFTRPIVSSFSSIRDTISHIAFAEWIWLQRWLGESSAARPEWSAEPPFETVRDRIRSTATERDAYLSGRTDESIGSAIDYRNTRGEPFRMELGDLLVHCANHSTYHRGQLVTMIRQAGGNPPNTDYIQFVRAVKL
jgi:uncharacterized damage-inducible protein DinB